MDLVSRPVLLSLDPGRDTGWSAWDMEERLLLACGVVSPDEPVGRWQPAQVVVELPRVYMRSKANPDDIIKLALKVGRYVERYGGNAEVRGCPVDLVKPSDWKGTLDGDVMTKRIEAGLTPHEERIVAAGRYRAAAKHDMLDSIGLAKWWLEQRRLTAALKAGPPAPKAA